MPDAVQPIPDGYGTITPHMVLSGASDAIEFYKKAFGAEEIARMAGPDGKSVLHAELQFGDSRVMLCDEFPGMKVSPRSLGGTTVTMHIYSEDVDAAFQRAVDAGATVTMEVTDTFWGDRYGKVTDPWGHIWSLATHKQDPTLEQINEGAAQYFSEGPS